MESTSPNLFFPNSVPESHKILVKIQSTLSEAESNSRLHILRVNLLPLSTANLGNLSPIFALIIWFPSGVLLLSFFCPTPKLAVDILYCFLVLLLCKSFSICSETEIYILVVIMLPNIFQAIPITIIMNLIIRYLFSMRCNISFIP